MVTVFGEALRSISAILNTCVRAAFFPDGTARGWNTNWAQQDNRIYLFLFLVEICCVPRRGGGGRERQSPTSTANPVLIVWLLTLAKSPLVIPYAENLGSSATVLMDTEIQTLTNFWFYIWKIWLLFPHLLKKKKKKVMEILLIHSKFWRASC